MESDCVDLLDVYKRQELDRVLGGGLVKGSLVLLGGDPGIGKSTMLLQICEYLGKEHTILYISGEESVRQIKLRADRLGVHCANLYVVSETNVDVITATIEQSRPDIVMIDSIQTMNLHQLPSSPGSVSQVRECTSRLLSVAKSLDIPTILVDVYKRQHLSICLKQRGLFQQSRAHMPSPMQEN